MGCIVDQYCVNNKGNGEVIITDTIQNIDFCIDAIGEKSLLYSLSNKGAEPVDVVIPRQFPSGHRIDFLGQNFVHGEFGKITISNGISVMSRSFRFAKVGEVVWPDNEYVIGVQCFEDSTIKKLSNIENVKEICDRAFYNSDIKDIRWPKACYCIPEHCFCKCSFLSKINIQNVKEIQNAAFSCTGIKKMTWPTQCKRIPIECFDRSELEEIDNLVNVESIGREAFFYTKLNVLDLSNTNISHLEKGSLNGLPKDCNIVPPYYITQEEYEEYEKLV